MISVIHTAGGINVLLSSSPISQQTIRGPMRRRWALEAGSPCLLMETCRMGVSGLEGDMQHLLMAQGVTVCGKMDNSKGNW